MLPSHHLFQYSLNIAPSVSPYQYKCEHVRPLLTMVLWLLVPLRVEAKVITESQKSLHDLTPLHLWFFCLTLFPWLTLLQLYWPCFRALHLIDPPLWKIYPQITCMVYSLNTFLSLIKCHLLSDPLHSKCNLSSPPPSETFYHLSGLICSIASVTIYYIFYFLSCLLSVSLH